MIKRWPKKQAVLQPPYPEGLQRDIGGYSVVSGNIEGYFPKYTEVISAAKEIIRKYYRFERHHIGAAVYTANGKIFAAVNLEATIGRIAVCAEPIAIGMACAAGENDIKIVAAFSGCTSEVVPPCGMCRELIYDYAPECEVIIPYLFVPSEPTTLALYRVPINELLPVRYTRKEKIQKL